MGMGAMEYKTAAMVKRISGIARLKGAPTVSARPVARYSRIGTFLDGDTPVASILLEVADTPESRRRGLMGRESVPPICGMEFTGLSGGGHFWMKGCLIPIDVAFLDADGTVIRTYEMPVDPEGEKRYHYGPETVSAIEAMGGFLEKWGIRRGFKVETHGIGGGHG